jgi:hypothetical protein
MLEKLVEVEVVLSQEFNATNLKLLKMLEVYLELDTLVVVCL